MPVLINKDGVAVDIPKEQVQSALSDHFVPLVSPEGEDASAPIESVKDFIASGYSQPDTKHLESLLKYAKHSTLTEQAKTFAEGAASAATLGLSTGLETALGVDPEDIASRRETNPGTYAAGQVTGVVGSLAVPGSGAVGTASRVAEAASQAANLSSRLGTRLVKEAIEGAIFQGGDEVSKAFISDPNQSVESVASSIGLSGLLSGSMGAAFYGGEKLVAPIWDATKGSTLSKALSSLKEKASGVTGANDIDDFARAAGIELSPVMKATLSSEEGGLIGSQLRESSTLSGQSYNTELNTLQKAASERVMQGLRKTEADLSKIGALSDYEEGLKIKDSLVNEIEARLAPITKDYDSIKASIVGKEVPNSAINDLADNLGKISLESGSAVRPGSEEAKFMNSLIKDVQNIKTLNDLEVFQSSVNADLTSKQMFGLKKKIMGALRNAEENIITNTLGSEAPELLGTYASARMGYRDVMTLVDDISDRLRPGKYASAKGFISNLKDMAPEDVLKRLRGLNDVDLQKNLEINFPQVSQSIKDYHVNTLLKKAGQSPRAVEGGIDTRVLFKQLDTLSPELKDSILSQEQQTILNSARSIMERLPERVNPSGTAKALDSMFSTSGGAMALAGLILSGGSASGALMGFVAKQLGREVPDAIKLGLLKVLGTEGPVNARAFKGMVNFIDQSYKAAKQTKRVVGNVLKPGAITLIHPMTSAEVEKLDEKMQTAQLDPNGAIKHISDFSSYLPDQATAAGMLSARAMTYLTKLRPQTGGATPLDPPRTPNPVEKAKYERALQIAEQPLLILESLKDGTLTKDDLTHLGVIYPALYTQYRKDVMAQIIEAKDRGETIPYRFVPALSMFLQQPLESSILPGNIMANQNIGLMSQPQPAAPSASSVKELANRSQSTMTPSQTRQQSRQSN